MSGVEIVASVLIGITAFVVFVSAVVMSASAFTDGDIDGSLDVEYPRRTRSNDHHVGVWRSLYEIGYARGRDRELRQSALRAARRAERGASS